MTETTDMATILASFSTLNIVKPSGLEKDEIQTNWAADGPREISDDDNDEEDEVPSAPPRPVVAGAAARQGLAKFDYGIMARSKSPVKKNRGYALPSEKRRLSQLPRDFMLASNMLSIRDPWEDAAANGYFDLKKKKNWMGALGFWVIVLCVVAVGCSIIWAHYSGACTGLQSAVCRYGHCYVACRIISYFR